VFAKCYEEEILRLHPRNDIATHFPVKKEVDVAAKLSSIRGLNGRITRLGSIALDPATFLAFGTDLVGCFQWNFVGTADVIEKPRAADKSNIMHMTIKRLAGDHGARSIIRVKLMWSDDDDRAWVITEIRIPVRIIGIITAIGKRIVLPLRGSRSPVALHARSRTATAAAGLNIVG
jgi:hypothetical protein